MSKSILVTDDNGNKYELTPVDTKTPEQPQPKKLLRYPNGAVAEPLENGQRYFIARYDVINSEWGTFPVSWGGDGGDLIYPTQAEAKEYCDRRNRYDAIERKIMEIDRDWSADWGDGSQLKYRVLWNYPRNCLDYEWNSTHQINGTFYFSDAAKDYVMSLPKEDQKLFVTFVK